MHIGDGLIPLEQAVIYWIAAVLFVALSLRWARKEMDESMIPIFAALAAGIFAIQALNIPIPWGTSGHMIGAVLAAIILGSPFAGILILTLVLIVQGFLFGDGGISVMGANILNNGVIASFTGYYTFRMIKGSLGMAKASFIGGWVGIFIGALAVAIELAIAGTFPLIPAMIWMGTFHAVIGVIGEGLITAIVVTSMMKTRPDLVASSSKVAVPA
ncbi:MAG: cobalt transporter CbiM [Candidatus Methanoperedenaceae archaeon]|nr:cobalt transporter CbiM [Candidatus Methanoperedenaceae archaeon]